MIVHNRIKTNIFSTSIELLFAFGYLFLNINGYFGSALIDWSFLSGLLVSMVHPVSFIGLVPFIIIIYLKNKQKFQLGYENMNQSMQLHLTILIVSTIVIVSIYFVNQQLALIYAFIYSFIIGFFSAYLIGVCLFEVKNS